MAIWSLTLGILSNTCLWILGSIPAILLGIVAIRKIDASAGSQKGRGLAIAGIVTGGVGFIGGLFPVSIAAAMLIPSFTAVQEQARATKEISQARQVYVACRSYEADFGQLPGNLGELIPDFIPTDDLIHVQGETGERLPLLYSPGMTASDDPEQPIIAGPQPYRKGRVVVRVSGQVGLVPEEEFQATMAAKFETPAANH